MAKKSKVERIELLISGELLGVEIFRHTEKPYLLGRKRIVNSYPLTSSSNNRLSKVLKKSIGCYTYTRLGYRMGDWEPVEKDGGHA